MAQKDPPMSNRWASKAPGDPPNVPKDPPKAQVDTTKAPGDTNKVLKDPSYSPWNPLMPKGTPWP